jgi:hypothetical protein
MSPRDWMLPVTACLAGLGIGLVIPRGTEATRPAVLPADTATRAPAASPASASASFTLDDIRHVVREEIMAHESESGVAPPVAESARAAPPPPSAAEARAAATLDAAIARRVWTEADAEALRADFTELSAAQRAEWLRQYSVAVNQGRLVPETERGPL